MNLKDVVVAVDFDGTCVTHAFPKVGREIGAPRVLRRMVEAGAKLVLWTMRYDGVETETARNGLPFESPDPLTDAVKWFEKHGIPLYGIQRNPDQDEWTSSPKAYAHLYIDDAALGCPTKPGLPGERPHVDWDAVEAILFPKDVLAPMDKTTNTPSFEEQIIKELSMMRQACQDSARTSWHMLNHIEKSHPTPLPVIRP